MGCFCPVAMPGATHAHYKAHPLNKSRGCALVFEARGYGEPNHNQENYNGNRDADHLYFRVFIHLHGFLRLPVAFYRQDGHLVLDIL